MKAAGTSCAPRNRSIVPQVYALVDHHRNNAPSAGIAYLAFWRHSLEGSSGALDVAGAVNVGDGEEPRSQCIVRIKS